MAAESSAEATVGTKLSLTARLRALEEHMEAIEANVMKKVDNKTNELKTLTLHCQMANAAAGYKAVESQVMEKVNETLEGELRKAGIMNQGLARLVEQVSFEQMDARTKMSAIDEDMASLKTQFDGERLDHKASELPAAFSHLDELCRHLTIKLEATSEAEADMRQEILELRSEVHSGKEMTAPTSNASGTMGLAGALMQLDEICRQLASKAESASDAEEELRQQIAEVRDRSQISEHGIEELWSEVRRGNDIVAPKADMMMVDFNKSLKHSKLAFGASSAIEMDLGTRSCSGVGFSAKSRVLDRAPSCPCLPPLASVR